MKNTFLISLSVILCGCSASTQFNTTQDNTALTVKDNEQFVVDFEQEHTYSTTSFGQYEFKAESEGYSAMYGSMPLKFNGGYLVADILFFAPALFFNLREVFPYYEFDVENKLIKYKNNEQDEWTVYQPSQAEVDRAMKYFGDAKTSK
ncbi:hypothetical protein [Vibrio hippocampi]|uniref:Lipoprotein n=1 Tax=Vibrio hippocampi TaxID=654686 RepID=A0ABM8ZI73_9VIBR|nr:hypothetical protein [Vibrio hippocampi]CAH0526213.1 hypothetical protein VHP8226_01687 [Vibrio hippocampi]